MPGSGLSSGGRFRILALMPDSLEPSASPRRASPVKLARRNVRGRRQLGGPLSAEVVTQATREDILRAATAEFARAGFAAASVEAIAARTRASKRMVYYHFGGKLALYEAVLEAAYTRVRRVDPPGDPAADPMAALRQYAQSGVDHFMANPDFVRLVLYENLAGAPVVRRNKVIAAISAGNLQSLQAIVEAGQRAGCMRPDLSVSDLFLTVVGMSFHAVSNRETVRASMGVDMLGAQGTARRRELVAELVSRYAAAVPEA